MVCKPVADGFGVVADEDERALETDVGRSSSLSRRSITSDHSPWVEMGMATCPDHLVSEPRKAPALRGSFRFRVAAVPGVRLGTGNRRTECHPPPEAGMAMNESAGADRCDERDDQEGSGTIACSRNETCTV
jgi:hypothetical protein